MIYSDDDILKNMKNKTLGIKPFEKQHLTPNGYDLSIETIEVEKTEAHKENGYYMIKPLTHFMVLTKETVEMPNNIMADLRIKTKWARQGTIGSFGAIDAGFKGKLNLSMFNGKNNFLNIPVDSTICQILFIKMTNSAKKLYNERSGNYQNQNKIME